MQHPNDKQRKEQLSALLDNQLKPDELQLFMDNLNRDPLAEGDTLQRYQLIGKTLRGELDAAAFIDVSAAVHRALAADTTVPTKVRQVPARWLPAMQTLLRPAAGLAIAASVAMVTIVSVRVLQQTTPTNAPELVTVVPAVVPVVAAVMPAENALTQTSGLSQPATVSPRLNNYLMRHSGVAGQATMQGVMPYARTVSFEQAGAP